MADKKITDLALRSNVDDDVNVPVDDGIATYRVTAPQWITYILTKIVDSITTAMIQDSAVTRVKIAAAALPVPTLQKFTATGTQTGWLFSVTSANATIGATYTNNSNTFTVLATISAGTLLWCSGTGATSGGTLTKATGTGDSTIAFSPFKQAIATYTTPAGISYLKVRGVAGGGGGSGGGTGSWGNAADGSITSFGANLLVGTGGSKAALPSGGSTNGGAGGTASLGTGPYGLAISGTYGDAGSYDGQNSVDLAGGIGGSTPFGGYGATTNTGGGLNAVANTGGGGGGAGSSSPAGAYAGAGGGGGGYFEAFISSPAATYVYVIGTGGAGGTAGASGSAGGNGADGILLVEEHYQ